MKHRLVSVILPLTSKYNFMRAQIILFRRMPPKINYFDYLVPKNLEKEIKIGQLVEIPFRNNNEYGLVYSLEQNSLLKNQTKLRALNKICFSTPFLPQSIFEYYKEISSFYATDLGFIYKFSFPKFTKKFFNDLTVSDFSDYFAKKNSAKPHLVVTPDNSTTEDFLQKNISLSGQNLILIPEKNDLTKLEKYFSDKFPTVVLSSDLTDKKTSSLWKKIRKNEDVLVIGTRKALFLPWVNLKNIFILDEGNENYKSYDMAPRYHTRDATMLLSKFTGCQIYLISHSPSISSFYFAEQKKYILEGNLNNLKKSFKLIDLNLEKRAKNYSPLSFELLEELKNLDRKDSAFMFLNKKGSAGYLFCGDCKKPFLCQKCGRPLAYFGNKKELRCNFCETVQPLIGSCPNCQSFNLKMRNPGTESVEKELRKESELKHFQIVRLDSELEKNTTFEHRPGTIYVGTEMAWALIPWSKIKLICFINTDPSLMSTEYKNIEHLWQKIRDSFYKTSLESSVILQTSHPSHYLFSSLNQPGDFYKNQLLERSIFQYPPFNYWLKLAIFSPNANLAIKEANSLKNRLEDLTKTVKNAKISGPHQAIPYFQKGNYRYILLVRLGYENYHTVIKEINKIIPKNWKVDPNPNTLLSI